MHAPEAVERRRHRAETAAAAAVCALCLLAALALTRDRHPATPDTLYNAIVARSLARGSGFEIGLVPYHVGRFPHVEHVAEMHGMLQPLLLAGLFRLAGEEQALLRVPGFVYVALTGGLAFLYGRRLFGSAAGCVAGALTLSSALLWFGAWFGADDAGFAFWFLAAIFGLDVAIESRSSGRFALAGLAAACALLQKPAGVVLLAPAIAVVAVTAAPLRSRLRLAAFFVAPWAAAFALTLLRNRAATGSWMPRFGPLDWLYKAHGIEAYFAVYDERPSLAGVLASLGASRVAAIVLAQLGELAHAALSLTPVLIAAPKSRLMAPAFLSLVGLAALLLHARARPRFALLFGLSLLGMVGLVCGVWHFEVRYLQPLVPLLAISIGGAVFAPTGPARTGFGRTAALAAPALALVFVALGATASARWLASVPVFPGPLPCHAALDWIRRETAPGDRLLAFDPWTIAWATERASIVVPSGPRADVEKVVAWYDPGWLVQQPVKPSRAASVATVAQMLANPTPGFAATRVFTDGECAVHRITTSRDPAAAR